jgi:Arc-like DNA binding domain.
MEKSSIRITLRIPEQLHEKLTDSANTGTRSLNSEIVKRLEESYCVELVNQPLTVEDVRRISAQVLHEKLKNLDFESLENNEDKRAPMGSEK